MKYKMEMRQCALHNCVGRFKVLEKDKQQYCSDFCEQSIKKKGCKRKGIAFAKVLRKTTETLWDNQPKRNEIKNETGITKGCKTQNLEQKKKPENLLSETRKLLNRKKSIKQEQGNTIINIKLNKIKPEVRELKTTPIKTLSNENTMPETENKMPQNTTNLDVPVTPQLDCTLPPTTIKLVESASMNLIDDTTQHLFGLMKGLTANAVPADLQKTPTHIAETAVKCATEIRGLLKLKLDVIKVVLEHGQ